MGETQLWAVLSLTVSREKHFGIRKRIFNVTFKSIWIYLTALKSIRKKNMSDLWKCHINTNSLYWSVIALWLLSEEKDLNVFIRKRWNVAGRKLGLRNVKKNCEVLYGFIRFDFIKFFKFNHVWTSNNAKTFSKPEAGRDELCSTNQLFLSEM